LSIEGQHYRNIVKQAKELDQPCVQFTPVGLNSMDEWAKMLFFACETMGKISEKIGLHFHIGVEESVRTIDRNQCKKSTNGLHELYNLKIDNDHCQMDHMVCLDCGEIFYKTEKTSEEIKEKLMKMNFNKDELIGPKDEVPF